MKRWLVVLLVLAVIVGCGEDKGLEAEDTAVPDGPYVVMQNDNSSVTLSVEIADDRVEWEHGLMERTTLDELSGMLFIFPDAKRRNFWMKNTYIPLDIIFMDAAGTILNIEDAVPCPNHNGGECPLYRSTEPAKYVLEVNSGLCDSHHITPGNIVKMFV